MIPPEFTGGWQRVTMALDGGEPFEDSTVWWLQAPSLHADLRVPLTDAAGPMSFAGLTTWEDPRLTWHPALELDPSIFEDIGVITWDGDDMMEAGTFEDGGRTVAYVERWRRIPGSDGEQVALSREGGRIVRTGDVALTLVDARPGGGFVAVAWRLVDGAWTYDHSWPTVLTETELPARPPLDLPDDTPTVQLDDALTWTIDEHRKVAHTHG